MLIIIFFYILSFFPLTSYATETFGEIKASAYSCEDPAVQQKRSAELQTLMQDDQNIRKHSDINNNESLKKLLINDLKRRKRVGEIFAEGCIKKAHDYFAAALIFQHGNVPDHYYQAFLWAKKSAELGYKEGNYLAALAIDRYLVNTDHKQLFGSQITQPNAGACFCMYPVEVTVSDEFRKKYAGFTLQDKKRWMAEMNKGKNCPTAECKMKLKSLAKGSVPGVW